MICGKKVTFSRPHPICDACERELTPYSGQRCEVCSRPLSHEGRCTICNERKFAFDEAFSVFAYKDEIRQAIHRLKFSDRPNYAFFFAEIMARCYSANKVDVVCSVPVSKKRLQERGYDQSAILAELFAKQAGLTYVNALKRIKDTPYQTKLGKNERFKNVKNAFAIREGADVTGKSFILTDDIFTTGATINECSKTLKEAGAKHVKILCLSAVEESV